MITLLHTFLTDINFDRHQLALRCRGEASRLHGIMNARSIAAGPSARATAIASRRSISSDGSPHISQSVRWISSGC